MSALEIINHELERRGRENWWVIIRPHGGTGPVKPGLRLEIITRAHGLHYEQVMILDKAFLADTDFLEMRLRKVFADQEKAINSRPSL